MKLTLVHPPQFIVPTNHTSTSIMPPLGLAYLAASLETAGHQIRIVDSVGEGIDGYVSFGPVHLHGLAFDDVVARIPTDTDAIGVGIMFSCSWLSTRELLKKIKAKFPGVPLVLGGEHPTGMPERSLEQAPVDVIVSGEGEETLAHLMDHFAGRAKLSEIPGIVYREGDRTVRNPPRARIRDIDSIPLPAWRHIDIEAYMRYNQPHGVARGRFMPMLATRGCPYECTFCTNPAMWTRRWIARDHLKVVDEMEFYRNRYQAVDFQFEDLTAIVRKDWLMAFCQEILKRDLKLTWQLPSGTRSEAIDAEAAGLMKKSGCLEFAYAPESGSPETLRRIKKQVSLDRLYDSARTCMGQGITVQCNFIIGFPFENWKDILLTYWATIRCAWMGIGTVNFNAFSPQPSTELFHELLGEGKIKLDDEFFFSLFTFQGLFGKKKSYNDQFPDWVLTSLVIFGYVLFFGTSFLRRPSRLWNAVSDIFRPDSETRLGKVARATMRELWRIYLSPLLRRAPGGLAMGNDG